MEMVSYETLVVIVTCASTGDSFFTKSFLVFEYWRIVFKSATLVCARSSLESATLTCMLHMIGSSRSKIVDHLIKIYGDAIF